MTSKTERGCGRERGGEGAKGEGGDVIGFKDACMCEGVGGSKDTWASSSTPYEDEDEESVEVQVSIYR